MVPGYPSTELRQSSEKTKQEMIRIPRSNFFEIWNCNQKSTISNLNRSSKDGKYRHCHKRNHQKSVLIKKENFKCLVLQKLYQKVSCTFVNFLPYCVPASAPLTLPFKNFNRATFTTYYIKKVAGNFTLNRVLLMPNAYFCFNKNFFYRFIGFIEFFQTLKRLPGRQIFLNCYRSAGLERLTNSAIYSVSKKKLYQQKNVKIITKRAFTQLIFLQKHTYIIK